jgi:hypothetical protein
MLPAIAILDSAFRTRFGKPFVRPVRHQENVVNRSEPELFPVMTMLNGRFIPAEQKSAEPAI